MVIKITEKDAERVIQMREGNPSHIHLERWRGPETEGYPTHYENCIKRKELQDSYEAWVWYCQSPRLFDELSAVELRDRIAQLGAVRVLFAKSLIRSKEVQRSERSKRSVERRNALNGDRRRPGKSASPEREAIRLHIEACLQTYRPLIYGKRSEIRRKNRTKVAKEICVALFGTDNLKEHPMIRRVLREDYAYKKRTRP